MLGAEEFFNGGLSAAAIPAFTASHYLAVLPGRGADGEEVPAPAVRANQAAIIVGHDYPFRSFEHCRDS